MSSKLEPVIWLRVLVTLAYMKGWTDVRTDDVHDVMAMKPNFLTSMGYQYFLNYGAPRAELRYEGAGLIDRLETRSSSI